ncbi:LacI family DNA-binding transcriptional regulator [Rhodococcus jostii]
MIGAFSVSFRLALADAGIGLAPELTHRGSFEFDAGRRAMQELLALPSPPTGVFCGNDVVAIGALNAALAAGVRVPDELSLIGFDDIPMASWEVFQLTTIGHDLDLMARTAAELLVERIKGNSTEPPRCIMSAPHVVERSTTAAPAPGLPRERKTPGGQSPRGYRGGKPQTPPRPPRVRGLRGMPAGQSVTHRRSLLTRRCSRRRPAACDR